MKIIIDIDKENYDYLKEQVAHGITNPFKILIANGTPYEGWIPASERLPEVDKDGYSDYILLSFENYGMPSVGMYWQDKDGNGAFHDGDVERTLVSVKAWMPLPEPYKAESER